MKQILGIVVLLMILAGGLQAQSTVSFNFSKAAQPVSGWINVVGDPATGTRSATDPTTGITLSSIGTSNWASFFNQSAADGEAPNNGTFFPAGVMSNEWFQYDANLAGYNAAIPQIKISGLDQSHTYTLRMTGSSTSAISQSPTRYTIAGQTVSGYIDVNCTNNTADGATFNPIAPDANGNIYVYVNTAGFAQAAGISGVQIITESLTHYPPVVVITSPQNGDILAEGGNVVIKATATEQNGVVTKVEFFADGNKIGESLSAPYTFTWVNPDAGHYTITAKATDYVGFTSTASISVGIEPLDGFWSMSGNISANADSNFLGTVDTNRLAFRTNNVERMSILKDGSVGIGTKDTYGYKLAVNGTAIFTKVRIKTAGTWPDYVFKKGYKLPDLRELERYIAEHKHLPGIVSESEVGQNGFDMGDHQKALLEKVEQLTLYLIEENKKLKEQNDRLLQQQREIDELKRLIKKK
ncbi:MAG: hypothetical protein JST68_29390 [Bacteroidetes bacterium]|nr:hypothetical protein [Bacteroidota bacterium]